MELKDEVPIFRILSRIKEKKSQGRKDYKIGITPIFLLIVDCGKS